MARGASDGRPWRAAGSPLGRRSKLPFRLGQLCLPRRRPSPVDKVICASGLSGRSCSTLEQIPCRPLAGRCRHGFSGAAPIRLLRLRKARSTACASCARASCAIGRSCVDAVRRVRDQQVRRPALQRLIQHARGRAVAAHQTVGSELVQRAGPAVRLLRDVRELLDVLQPLRVQLAQQAIDFGRVEPGRQSTGGSRFRRPRRSRISSSSARKWPRAARRPRSRETSTVARADVRGTFLIRPPNRRLRRPKSASRRLGSG